MQYLSSNCWTVTIRRIAIKSILKRGHELTSLQRASGKSTRYPLLTQETTQHIEVSKLHITDFHSWSEGTCVFLLTTFDAALNGSILITLTVGLAWRAGLHRNVVADRPVTLVAHLIRNTVFRWNFPRYLSIHHVVHVSIQIGMFRPHRVIIRW